MMGFPHAHEPRGADKKRALMTDPGSERQASTQPQLADPAMGRRGRNVRVLNPIMVIGFHGRRETGFVQ